jgi:hypothetical protein
MKGGEIPTAAFQIIRDASETGIIVRHVRIKGSVFQNQEFPRVPDSKGGKGVRSRSFPTPHNNPVFHFSFPFPPTVPQRALRRYDKTASGAKGLRQLNSGITTVPYKVFSVWRYTAMRASLSALGGGVGKNVNVTMVRKQNRRGPKHSDGLSNTMWPRG